MDRIKLFLMSLVGWYVLLFAWLAQSPVDRQFWAIASVLPALFVMALIATYRYIPLSPLSYALITAFLTLHTIGVHYTYSEVPAGAWLNHALHLGRNHFDRIVHFSFGFLLAYPMEEAFRLIGHARGWVLYYLPVITVLGLSGLWEIIEGWVTEAVHPELGPAYLGAQGDIWDAQKDMAAALYGSLICMGLLLAVRLLRRFQPGPVPPPDPQHSVQSAPQRSA